MNLYMAATILLTRHRLNGCFFRSCSQRFKNMGWKQPPSSLVNQPKSALGSQWWLTDINLVEIYHWRCKEAALLLGWSIPWLSAMLMRRMQAEALAAIDRYKLTFGVFVEAKASEIERRISETNHFRRGDSNALVARSTQSRVKYRPIENLPHTNQEPFAYGDIVIGNDTFGQYKNELQIVWPLTKTHGKTKSAPFQMTSCLCWNI